MKKIIEFIKYAFWGGISTGINLLLLFVMLKFTEIHYLVANSLSYLVAVIVNYVFNKKFVFESQNNVKKELINFIFVRFVSLGIDNVCYYVAVDIFSCDVYLSRLVISVLIIAATYVINKIFIFKKGES